MEPYEYQSFDLDQPYFRLLRLLKGKRLDPIACELFQAFLDVDVMIPYEALSYTWGGTLREESITVNEKHLGVTSNLYDALLNLRFQDQDRILWIDAICINQDDLAERGHQVEQMGRIYKDADVVLIWLGPITYETKAFIKFFQELGKDWNGGELLRSRESLNNARISAQTALAKLGSTQRQSAVKAGLEILLSRPWFNRVWILQEVANAKAARVCSGPETLSASNFVIAQRILFGKSSDHCRRVLQIMTSSTRQTYWRPQHRLLHELMWTFKECQATDARDKVFALLGLSSDLESHEIRADYTKPEEFSQQVAMYLFSSTHGSIHERPDSHAYKLKTSIYPSWYYPYLEDSMKFCSAGWLAGFLNRFSVGLDLTKQALEAVKSNRKLDISSISLLVDSRTCSDAIKLSQRGKSDEEWWEYRGRTECLESMKLFYQEANKEREGRVGMIVRSCKYFQSQHDFELWLECNNIRYTHNRIGFVYKTLVEGGF